MREAEEAATRSEKQSETGKGVHVIWRALVDEVLSLSLSWLFLSLFLFLLLVVVVEFYFVLIELLLM